MNSRNSIKALFQVVQNSSASSSDCVLPSYTSSTSSLCDDFADFFVTKVEKIINNIISDPSSVGLSLSSTLAASAVCTESASCPVALSVYAPLSVAEVSRLHKLKVSPSVDVLPITIMRQVYDTLLPAFTIIINESLDSAVFPDIFKCAIITPILKSSKSDSNMLSSYRPVSNLSFLSKLIETAVCNQLTDHINTHKLWHPNQSAYRKHHSVESALLSVSSSILQSLDRRRNVMFLMLDLSAAFDTVDHSILLDTLCNNFGIKGAALSWIRSYLSDRSFRVKCGNTFGKIVRLHTGVPQGSILGPILFNCYMTPLFNILDSLGVCFHNYADDIQVWCEYDPSSSDCETECRRKLSEALDVIVDWMANHSLKLNCNKTVFIPISRGSSDSFEPFVIGDDIIYPSSEARNLGFIFDSKFSFNPQISHIRRTAFFQLRRLQCCKAFIPPNRLSTLIHAFVTSRLDFCNSLYYGLSRKQVDKLQSVLVAAAKFITGAKKYDSATNALKTLHWLPVSNRIKYKLSTIAYHLFNTTPNHPNYFGDISPLVHHSINTRSSNKPTLSTSFRPKLKSFGDRAALHALVSCFNALPHSLRSSATFQDFKSDLKTHLFQSY
jgi:hypothetical protein